MEVEWVILADAADIVNGKLYIMGGGWDTFYVNEGFPARLQFGVAVALRVPWHETNHLHQVEVEFADQDGKVVGQLGGHVEAGRPPGTPRGHSQRIQIAFRLDLTFDKPGTLAVIAKTNGEESRRVSFNVVPGPMLKMQGQMGGTPAAEGSPPSE